MLVLRAQRVATRANDPRSLNNQSTSTLERATARVLSSLHPEHPRRRLGALPPRPPLLYCLEQLPGLAPRLAAPEVRLLRNGERPALEPRLMRYVVVATVQGTNATMIFVHSPRREPYHVDATASRNAMSGNACTTAKKNNRNSSSTKTIKTPPTRSSADALRHRPRRRPRRLGRRPAPTHAPPAVSQP